MKKRFLEDKAETLTSKLYIVSNLTECVHFVSQNTLHSFQWKLETFHQKLRIGSNKTVEGEKDFHWKYVKPESVPRL